MPVEVAKSASQRRSEGMCQALRERICLLHYPPGHRLSEEQLAREFKVSRTPVRHALAQLEIEKLIDRRHGAGTFVTRLDLDALEQVIRFRMRLAELIGDLDPLPPGAEHVEALRACGRRLQAIVDEPDLHAFARINLDYFLTVTSLIGNPSLRDVSERLFYQTARMWIVGLPELDWRAMVAKVIREIDEVKHAMELGDMHAVGLICRNYISMNLMLLLREERSRAEEAGAAGARGDLRRTAR